MHEMIFFDSFERARFLSPLVIIPMQKDSVGVHHNNGNESEHKSRRCIRNAFVSEVKTNFIPF